MKKNVKTNIETGKKGEIIAVKFLRSRGYKILHRNYIVPFGEIDIITVKDDILNLKPTRVWGKDNGEDIKEGKVTYLVADTMSKANESDRAILAGFLRSKEISDIGVKSAIDIMESYNSFESAERFVFERTEEAREFVDNIFTENKHKVMYHQYLETLLHRKK